PEARAPGNGEGHSGTRLPAPRRATASRRGGGGAAHLLRGDDAGPPAADPERPDALGGANRLAVGGSSRRGGRPQNRGAAGRAGAGRATAAPAAGSAASRAASPRLRAPARQSTQLLGPGGLRALRLPLLRAAGPGDPA